MPEWRGNAVAFVRFAVKWTRVEGSSVNRGQEGIEYQLEKRTVAGRQGRNASAPLKNSPRTADVDPKVGQLDPAAIHCLMQLPQRFSDR